MTSCPRVPLAVQSGAGTASAGGSSSSSSTAMSGPGNQPPGATTAWIGTLPQNWKLTSSGTAGGSAGSGSSSG